jgi:chromosome segregation ATPase
MRDIIVLTLTLWKGSQMPGELANEEWTKPPAENGLCFFDANTGQKECPSELDESAAAMQLVYELAGVVRTKEDRAREMEARAQDLARRSLDELNLARMRVRSAEITHAKTEERVKEAMAKVDEFEQALKDTEARIASAEDQLAAAILRAETAEARAAEADEALRSLAGVIRTELLNMSGHDSNNSAMAA